MERAAAGGERERWLRAGEVGGIEAACGGVGGEVGGEESEQSSPPACIFFVVERVAFIKTRLL